MTCLGLEKNWLLMSNSAYIFHHPYIHEEKPIDASPGDCYMTFLTKHYIYWSL